MRRSGESSLYHFSFVTLTSLGDGDISPVSDAVRILATVETIIGVLLLAGSGVDECLGHAVRSGPGEGHRP